MGGAGGVQWLQKGGGAVDGNGFERMHSGLCRLLPAGLPALDEDLDAKASDLARRFALGPDACWGDLLMAALLDAGIGGNVQAIKQVLALAGLPGDGERDDGLLGQEFGPDG